MTATLTSHWIIVNYKKNTIYLKPFLTYQDAVKHFTPFKLVDDAGDWSIEERKSYQEVDEFSKSEEYAKY